MFGREPQASGLPRARAGSGRRSHFTRTPLSPSSRLPPWPSTSSRPVSYFLSQIEFGLSPECPRLSYLVLTYLPGPDALLFLMSICYYPSEAPLRASARGKPGFPQAAILNTSFPLPTLPSPRWAPSHFPEWDCVSLAVWEFPGPGARALLHPQPTLG